MKARIHMQQKNFMAACKTYERMLEKEPSATIYVALAECLRMMERPRESTQALLNAFSLAPRHPSIYMALTETFRRIDAPLKAYLMAARAQACGAQDAALLKTLAELFLNIKRHRIR
jgi:cytochrome c-type biogenesis protein CcmH/NrfG